MYAYIRIPDFGLQIGLGSRIAEPAALLDSKPSGSSSTRDGEVLVEINEQAIQCGVWLGMAASQAKARCPALLLVRRDPQRENEIRNSLIDFAMGLSPDVELTNPNGVTIDLSGSSVFKKHSPFALSQEWQDQVTRHLSLRTHFGLGDTPDRASLAAHSNAPASVLIGKTSEIVQTLKHWPITVLQPSPRLMGVLRLWGINTVGAFMQLPRSETNTRLGPEAVRMRNRLESSHRRILTLIRPLQSYEQSIEFEYEMDRLDPLLLIIRELLEILSTRLQISARVAKQLTLRLSFTNETIHERLFQIPEPSANVDYLHEMISTYLEGFTTESPIITLNIQIEATSIEQSQKELFSRSLQDSNRFTETLMRLESLLGAECVGRPERIDSHYPDDFRLRSFCSEDVRSDALPRPRLMPRLTGLPLRRFRPPIPIEVDWNPHLRPRQPQAIRGSWLEGRLIKVRGPWRLSGNWWDESHWKREEWDVQRSDGLIYRIYGSDAQWFVEGVYG